MARILIVEDYENLQSIYAAVLKKEGHDVTVVNDGISALEKTKKDQYDVILLDLLLPHMSGMEFLKDYEPKKHPETKVLMCSNFTSPKYIVEAGNLGVDHYLTKSNVTPAEIAAVIDKMLKEPRDQ
jgi:two-component system alkaline phosphatase synthesis response regulator PhoP